MCRHCSKGTLGRKAFSRSGIHFAAVSDLSAREFAALRDAITRRGHLRSGLALGGLVAWAGLLLATLVALPYPVAAVVPLLVLVATFEIIRPLNAGAERIGRYLQVFFEEPTEQAEAPLAPRLGAHGHARRASRPGRGRAPALRAAFALATVVNLLAVLLPRPVVVELTLMATAHAAFLAWLWRRPGHAPPALGGPGPLPRAPRRRSLYPPPSRLPDASYGGSPPAPPSLASAPATYGEHLSTLHLRTYPHLSPSRTYGCASAMASSRARCVPFQESVLSNDSLRACASRPRPPPSMVIAGMPRLIG